MRSFIPRSAMVHTHSFGVSQDDDEAVLPGSEAGKSSNPIILIDDEVVQILAIPIKPSYHNGTFLVTMFTFSLFMDNDSPFFRNIDPCAYYI